MCNIALHIFQLNEDGPSSENLEEETENIVAANHWVLPAGICDSNSRWRTPRTGGWRTAHISLRDIVCLLCSFRAFYLLGNRKYITREKSRNIQHETTWMGLSKPVLIEGYYAVALLSCPVGRSCWTTPSSYLLCVSL